MTKNYFDKVLVANRGEIVIRIIKTLKKLGIKSVAIYSESDLNSLHVQYADEAYFVGSSPATESYLSIPNIINAIRETGAQAVHPGYGFLSENPNFATALKKEGIKLIGPSVQAIKKMGDKIEAKKIAIESSVNTVPGYIGVIKDKKQAIKIAGEIGYPVIVKAAAGGGGRGMRVVQNDDEMVPAFESAKIEAENSFSDGRVFIEKFIQKPRHIEIQVLADQQGNVVCLGERECSIQRHHQKVIEEAPSIVLTNEIREKMYEQSKALCAQVGYYSAGTIEFMLDSHNNFYFLEMNTRLQVEHCVTELITGIDIVEEMIKIAAGKPLSFTQEDVILKGHAIECRIYAEDPLKGFLPSSGRITEYQEPPKNLNIRVDTGVSSGTEVSMFYDPMVSKLCTYGDTRLDAITLMQSALSSYVIRGINHNISFLEAIMQHKRFIEGDIDTGFIKDEYPSGFLGADLTSELTEIFLCVAVFIHLSREIRASHIVDQINENIRKVSTRWIVYIDKTPFPVIIKPVQDGYNIRQGSQKLSIKSNWTLGSKLFVGLVNGKKVNVNIDLNKTGYILTHGGVRVEINVRSPKVAELENIMPKDTSSDDDAEIKAPLSGKILSIKCQEGQSVLEGQELVVLTSMKMENIIIAPISCVIDTILIKEGDNTSQGDVIITIRKD